MLVKWNPFEEMVRLQDEINRIFDEFMGRRSKEGTLMKSEWVPAVDIQEDNEKILITADLPGMKKENISVKVENNTLTISGERKEEKEEKGKDYIRRERVCGSFVRSFTLPHTVDIDKIKAEYKDGVLSLILPKKPEARPKQIDIKIE